MTDLPLEARLAACLGSRLDVTDVEVRDLHVPQEGRSGSMISFCAVWQAQGIRHQRKLIARFPANFELFLDYDPAYEWRAMEALAGWPVPVPPLLFHEPDPAVLGRPFYVMGHVEGRVPQTTPSYHATGFVADELGEAERAELWFNGLTALAELHALDCRRGFDFLRRPHRGARGLDQYLDWVRDWYQWMRAGRAYPIVEAALDHLFANKPRDAPDAVLWGDARIGNVVFDSGNRVAALLDWEMAALGPAEVDLAWWVVMDQVLSEGLELPRLAGLPDRAESVAFYERASGRPVRHIEYYEILAALRFALVLIRATERYRSVGLVDADTTFGSNSPPMRLLAQRLGIVVPELSPDIKRLMGRPFDEKTRAATSSTPEPRPQTPAGIVGPGEPGRSAWQGIP
jgi:aminoglycoside phosphotransferase (APT) family kinase protein